MVTIRQRLTRLEQQQAPPTVHDPVCPRCGGVLTTLDAGEDARRFAALSLAERIQLLREATNFTHSNGWCPACEQFVCYDDPKAREELTKFCALPLAERIRLCQDKPTANTLLGENS